MYFLYSGRLERQSLSFLQDKTIKMRIMRARQCK